MPGIKALRMLQLGRETTAGTIVPATTRWRGLGTLQDSREPVFPEEDIGYLSGTDRSYISFIEGALDLESTPATYEQLPHILEMGIKAATPSQDGSGSGYIYQYDFPTTQPNTIKTYTIEGGDNQQAEVMEYCFASEFTLEGNEKEAWMMSASILGRQIAKQAFTGSVAVPSIDHMLFQNTKMYIDAIDGTWGTTLKSNTLKSASLKFTTGIIPKYAADGTLYFSFIQYTMPEVVLSVTFEHDGTAVLEKDNFRDQTPRLIRLLNEGPAFTTAGTTYSKKTGIIDLAGKWSSFDKLGDQDGNDVIEAEFTARYNATAAKFGKIVVVNALSSLP